MFREEEEIAVVRSSVQALSALDDFKSDTKLDAIIVFESDQDLDSLAKTISSYTGQDIAVLSRTHISTTSFAVSLKSADKSRTEVLSAGDRKARLV